MLPPACRQKINDTMTVVRHQLSGIIPSAAVDSAAASLAAVIDDVTARITGAAEQLQAKGGPVDEAAKLIEGLTSRVRGLQHEVAAWANATEAGLPGPMLDTVLGQIRTQVGLLKGGRL